VVAGDAQLLREYVERLNAGVRSGDFGPMLDQLAEDAELVFEGIPVGPFAGRAAIAEAYRTNPPDDEIDLLVVEDDPAGGAAAVYAWSRRPGVPAGALHLDCRDGRIARILVRYGDDGRPAGPAS
jgi:steroid Delta-isomerase